MAREGQVHRVQKEHLWDPTFAPPPGQVSAMFDDPNLVSDSRTPLTGPVRAQLIHVPAPVAHSARCCTCRAGPGSAGLAPPVQVQHDPTRRSMTDHPRKAQPDT